MILNKATLHTLKTCLCCCIVWNLLADEAPLWDVLQSPDTPAFIPGSEHLESAPKRLKTLEGYWLLSVRKTKRLVSYLGMFTTHVEIPFSYLSPFWTTRFLHVLQQEHAWLHSKMRGGSSRQNSGRRQPLCSSIKREEWG